MHRTKTHFAARINHVASALERRGIRATYELHDRVLSNRSSRRRLAQSPPALDDAQQRVVADLEREGFSLTTFQDFFGDDALWARIEEQAAQFVAHTENALAGDRDALRVHFGKEFVVRLHSYGVELGPDDPWLSAASSRRMLDVANSYVGLWTKLEYLDLWYQVPQPEDAARKASQRWHRDYNDRRLVKAFVYLVDVDEGNGPFEYVPGSAPGGPHSDLYPWRPLGENYPPQDELERSIAGNGSRVFTGAKGTLLFCNTAGFHRGGFATQRPRVLATVTYSSPASLASLTERSFTYTGPREALDEPTRFALA